MRGGKRRHVARRRDRWDKAGVGGILRDGQGLGRDDRQQNTDGTRGVGAREFTKDFYMQAGRWPQKWPHGSRYAAAWVGRRQGGIATLITAGGVVE